MVALIVAYDRNRCIGKGGKIPWKIPGEQKRFKELTMGNAVIMGRKTYEEIGRPLPGRLNIVVSTTKKFAGENLLTADNPEQALQLAGDKDVFIAGGSRLYRWAAGFADVMYVTEVDTVIENGDTFFPQFDESEFEKRTEQSFSGGIDYTYVTYTRKGKKPL